METYQITLKEFLEAIGKVAAEYNQDYYSAKVEINSKNGIELWGYINGNSWHKGSTIEDVCDKLRRRGQPIPSPIVDVVIHQ